MSSPERWGEHLFLCRLDHSSATLLSPPGMGVCRTSNYSQYVTFDGTHHTFRGTCTYVLVKVCHSTMDLPFFKISGKHRKQKGQSDASYLYQVNVDIFNTQVTLKSDTRVLVSRVM